MNGSCFRSVKVSKRFGQMGSHLTTAKFSLSRPFADEVIDVIDY